MKFTSREREVLDLAITGMSERDIAKLLGITPLTVKTYLTRIYREADIEDGHGSKRIRLMNKIRDER